MGNIALNPGYISGTLNPAIRNTVLQTELSGNLGKEFVFSLASGKSNSTYTFGLFQYDIGANPIGRNFLKSIGFQPDEISKLADPSTMTDPVLAGLNSKLSSAFQNPAVITAYTKLNDDWTNTLSTGITNVISDLYASNTSVAQTIASSADLQLRLVDYWNEFGYDRHGAMATWLAGGSSIDPRVASIPQGGAIDASMIYQFISYTKYGINSPSGVQNRENRLETALSTIDPSVGPSYIDVSGACVNPLTFNYSTIHFLTGFSGSLEGADDTIYVNPNLALTITGTRNGIYIGDNDSVVVAGSSNTTFVQGTRDATVIQGSGEKTVVTGTSNTVSDQGTGDHNWLTGTGNTINVVGSSNTTEVQNTGNTANIKGVSDITVVESNNDTTNITGTTDQTWTEGTNDTTSVQGTSAATVILGNNSQTSVSGVTDTTWVLGATDVTTVTGSGEATVVQGSTDSTTISGNNETSWIQGSHDTTTESGTSDTAYVSGASDITWAQGNYDSTWQTGVGDVAHELNSSDTVYDSGTGDSYQNEWTGGYYGGYGGGGGGYYGYYSSKISNAAGSNIISISGKEVIHGNTSSSITANASPSQAPMPPSLLASTGGAGNAVLEAAQWDQVAITWKSTSGIDPASSSLVGIPNSSYDAVFGGAFAASLKVAVVDIGQLPQSAGLGGGIGLDKLIPSPTIATSMAQLTQSMGSFAPSAPGHMESLAANEASWRFAPMAAASR